MTSLFTDDVVFVGEAVVLLVPVPEVLDDVIAGVVDATRAVVVLNDAVEVSSFTPEGFVNCVTISSRKKFCIHCEYIRSS